MDFIGGKARGGANGVVISVFWCSLLTMAHICAIVWYPYQLVHGGRQPSAELRFIIEQEGRRTSPQRDEAVHQNVCGASAMVTANMSARRLKRSVKRRMC